VNFSKLKTLLKVDSKFTWTVRCDDTTRITFRLPLCLRYQNYEEVVVRSLLDGRKCRNKFTYTVSSHSIHFYSIASRIYPRHYVPEYLVTRAAVCIYETICIELDIVLSRMYGFFLGGVCMSLYTAQVKNII